MKNKLNHKLLFEMAKAIRVLSIDAIEKAKSGHPGLPLGMADVVTVLFKNFLKFNPLEPKWHDRDRFILSAGHGSMLLYALGHLTGYKDVTLSQIKKFRQLGSKTAGHPEYGLLSNIETTTGPLGQGLANAVGMALSEKLLNQKFGNKLVNHNTWALVGDGCLMEGISQEAISLAGHLKLNKLIVIFDNNGISIDGKTNLTTSDNQTKRFQASNWNTISVNGHDYDEINLAFSRSIKSDKPTLISCKTTIGFGSPNKSGKSSSHGSPLGENESKLTKFNLGHKLPAFSLKKETKKLWEKTKHKGIKKYNSWKKRVEKSKNKQKFLNHFKKTIYKRDSDTDIFLKNILRNKVNEATRKSSQNSIEFLSNKIEYFLGGSADLTGSNLTKVSSSNVQGKNTNYIYYGVREHLMSAAMNGISLHGGYIPYGGTFLIFSDYCKNSIRLSALMRQQVIYVLTHDSIGLGEDGPTHQPIEQLASLRAIPNLLVMRPCDAIETFECWEIALRKPYTPTILALSRQSVPLLRSAIGKNKSMFGGYFLTSEKNNQITLIATGSEVKIAKSVQKILFEKKKIKSNIVSMPCQEIFNEQSLDYKSKILGKKPRVLIEAGSSFGWHKFLRDEDLLFCVDKFGESGKCDELYNHFGIEPKKIADKIIKKYL